MGSTITIPKRIMGIFFVAVLVLFFLSEHCLCQGNETTLPWDSFNYTQHIKEWRDQNALQKAISDNDSAAIAAKASVFTMAELAKVLYQSIVQFQTLIINTFGSYMQVVSNKSDQALIQKTHNDLIVLLTEYERLLGKLVSILTPEVHALIHDSFMPLMSKEHCEDIFSHRAKPTITELCLEFLHNPRQIMTLVASLVLVGIMADIYRQNNQEAFAHENINEYLKLYLSIAGPFVLALIFAFNSRKLAVQYKDVFTQEIIDHVQRIANFEKIIAEVP